MKNLLKSALLALVVTTGLWSCSDEQYADPGMTVNPNNISGTWKLTSWNGSPLGEGSYVYMDITRKDKECTLYQNVDSQPTARKVESTYNIYSDTEFGPVIRGIYKYNNGDWEHRYIIRDLSKESMTWIALDDQEDIQIFTRVDGIPGDILSMSVAQ